MKKLDRTAHWAGKHQDKGERLKEFWRETTVRERLEAAFYLGSH